MAAVQHEGSSWVCHNICILCRYAFQGCILNVQHSRSRLTYAAASRAAMQANKKTKKAAKKAAAFPARTFAVKA
jgi:hypothetical protein